MDHLCNPSVDRLFEAILQLETVEDCYAFFEDLCTARELHDFAQRLDVAFLLSEGKSYQSISQEADVSSVTISRVNRCLRGKRGGYRKMIQKFRGKGKNP